MPIEHQHWTSDSDLLDRYVLGNLEPEERAKLDAHIHECAECARVLREEQELVEGIRQFGREELKSRLKERLSKEEPQEIPWFKIVGVAATIVVLVTIGLYNQWFETTEADLMIQQGPEETNKTSELSQSKDEEKAPALAERSQGLTERQQDVRLKPPQDAAGGGTKQIQFEQQPTMRVQRDSAVPVPLAPSHAMTPSGRPQLMSAAEIKETVVSRTPEITVQALTLHAEQVDAGFWVEGVVLLDTKDFMKALKLKGVPAERSEPQTAHRIQTSAESHEQQVISLDSETQRVVLRQRPIIDLPKAQQQKQSSLQTIPTHVEQMEKELRMTLYLDPPVPNEILQSARIEPVTRDSVILHLLGKKIGYKIPGGWGKR